MKLRTNEIEFLSAWAREEKAPDPWALPAHQFQAANKISSVTLIRAIKAWARAESRRDEDIFRISGAADPAWPWASAEEAQKRLEEILTVQAAGAK